MQIQSSIVSDEVNNKLKTIPILMPIQGEENAINTAVINAIAMSVCFLTSDIAMYEQAKPVNIRVTPRAIIIRGFMSVTKGKKMKTRGMPIK